MLETPPRADAVGRSLHRAHAVAGPGHSGFGGGVRRRPGQLVVLGFAAAVALGTLLLRLPAASSGASATWVEALFTATSAVCVTGLVVVDTATHWSPFGLGVILALIQVGGLGIMTLATVLGLLISRRLGLSSRLIAASSTRTVGLGDVRSVLIGVLRVTLFVEAATAAVLAVRFMTTYEEPLGRALWLGLFHSVSAFNNAGFSTYTDNLIQFATDPWICLPIALAVIVGGIGFPVIFELRRQHRPARWSLHTRITLLLTAVLIVGGTAFMLLAEWSNPATLGPMNLPGKLLAGFFQGVMPRTAGFNSVDINAMQDGTWFGTDVLMFIGGGSAGTAGGIKVTTFAVLLYVIWAELRGDPDVNTFDRRIAATTQRQALSVALVSVAAVVIAIIAISLTSPLPVDRIQYEVISAFATVGLSTGITADLAPGHQLLLVALMFIGRLGPVTLGTALALRERQRLYRYPESAPIVG